MNLFTKPVNAWLALMVAIGGVMTTAGTGWAQQEVFVEPSGAQTASVDRERYRKNTQHRYVKKHRLVGSIVDLPTDKKQELILNLFPDAKYKVIISKFEAEGVENCWMGNLEGLPMSQVELYIVGSSITGRIDTGERLFTLTKIDGQTLVREIDKTISPGLDKDQRTAK